MVAYTAVIDRVPWLTVDVVSVATPPLSVPVPITVVPSLKVTVPVGTGPVAELTVAVNVTACPRVEGFRLELTRVVVAARFTTWLSTVDVLLA